jgi:hypothetical protein
MSLENDLRELFQSREGDISAPITLPRTTRNRAVGVKLVFTVSVAVAVIVLTATGIGISSKLLHDDETTSPAGSPSTAAREAPHPIDARLRGVYTHNFGGSGSYPSGVWHLTLRKSSYEYADSNTLLGGGRVRQSRNRLLLDRDSSCGRLSAVYEYRLKSSRLSFAVVGDDQCSTRASLFSEPWQRS